MVFYVLNCPALLTGRVELDVEEEVFPADPNWDEKKKKRTRKRSVYGKHVYLFDEIAAGAGRVKQATFFFSETYYHPQLGTTTPLSS